MEEEKPEKFDAEAYNKKLNAEIDAILPKDYDEYTKKLFPNNTGIKKLSTHQLKKKAYELIVKGHTSNSYIPLLMEEFGYSRKTVSKYIGDLTHEIKEQYDQINCILREAIVLDLLRMKNETRIFHEKIKCLELIIKVTGLATQNVNVTQNNNESRTFVITESDEIKDINPEDDIDDENTENDVTS